jgi:hypothetical protein
MPYEVREQEKGFKVCKKGSRRCYSNDPLPLNRAERQLKALYASEADMEGAGFFGNLLKRTFTGITDYIVRPRGFDPSKHTQGWLRRPFDMPPLHDLSQMVASTYKKDTPDIQGYTLLSKTPTVSFFQVNRKKNVIIIALRGTAFTDINDISADLGIVKTIVEDANTARNVRNSRRYIDDVATIKAFQSNASQYLPRPSAKMVYYAVGHSLSGAMIDELLEDGLVSSAVSFNPAIERVNFAKDNNNHRVYLSCDVLYNLLGKFITNGNLEVVEKENPFGADAGAIDASKGTIKCHNIETVIPLMSGKGIENNLSSNNKSMSFQDLINRSSSFRLDKFKPIGSPCDKILEQPITQDVGANSGRVRQQRAYRECLERQKQGASGSGIFDTIVGNLGRNLADEASKGNILGRIKNTIDEGARKRKEEQDREWNNSWVSKVIPNPMKLFGGAKPSHMLSREEAEKRFYEGDGRPYTFEEWDEKICGDNPSSRLYKKGQQIKARGDKWRGLSLKEWDERLCSGEDSVLAKKKRAIDARAKRKATVPFADDAEASRGKSQAELDAMLEKDKNSYSKNAIMARRKLGVYGEKHKPKARGKKETQDEIDERTRQKQDVELAKLDTYANPNLSQVARMRMLMSGERPMVRGEEAPKPAPAPVRYANAQEARDALRRSMMKSSPQTKKLLSNLSSAMRGWS